MLVMGCLPVKELYRDIQVLGYHLCREDVYHGSQDGLIWENMYYLTPGSLTVSPKPRLDEGATVASSASTLTRSRISKALPQGHSRLPVRFAARQGKIDVRPH